eukprot:jgi/Mesvir1/18191/Mv26573-RA.1
MGVRGNKLHLWWDAAAGSSPSSSPSSARSPSPSTSSPASSTSSTSSPSSSLSSSLPNASAPPSSPSSAAHQAIISPSISSSSLVATGPGSTSSSAAVVGQTVPSAAAGATDGMEGSGRVTTPRRHWVLALADGGLPADGARWQTVHDPQVNGDMSVSSCEDGSLPARSCSTGPEGLKGSIGPQGPEGLPGPRLACSHSFEHGGYLYWIGCQDDASAGAVMVDASAHAATNNTSAGAAAEGSACAPDEALNQCSERRDNIAGHKNGPYEGQREVNPLEGADSELNVENEAASLHLSHRRPTAGQRPWTPDRSQGDAPVCGNRASGLRHSDKRGWEALPPMPVKGFIFGANVVVLELGFIVAVGVVTSPSAGTPWQKGDTRKKGDDGHNGHTRLELVMYRFATQAWSRLGALQKGLTRPLLWVDYEREGGDDGLGAVFLNAWDLSGRGMDAPWEAWGGTVVAADDDEGGAKNRAERGTESSAEGSILPPQAAEAGGGGSTHDGCYGHYARARLQVMSLPTGPSPGTGGTLADMGATNADIGGIDADVVAVVAGAVAVNISDWPKLFLADGACDATAEMGGGRRHEGSSQDGWRDGSKEDPGDRPCNVLATATAVRDGLGQVSCRLGLERCLLLASEGGARFTVTLPSRGGGVSGAGVQGGGGRGGGMQSGRDAGREGSNEGGRQHQGEPQQQQGTAKVGHDTLIKQPEGGVLNQHSGATVTAHGGAMKTPYKYNNTIVSAYDRDRRVINQNMDWRQFPLAVTFPYHTAHVAAIVRCAVAAGVRVCARGGGHSYETLSGCSGAVAVSTRAFRSFGRSLLGEEEEGKGDGEEEEEEETGLAGGRPHSSQGAASQRAKRGLKESSTPGQGSHAKSSRNAREKSTGEAGKSDLALEKSTNTAPRLGNPSSEGSTGRQGLVHVRAGHAAVGLGGNVGTAVVGAGLTTGQVVAYLDEMAPGTLIPFGHCATVGAVGLTLTGGLSDTSRVFGFAADRLVSLEVVDARGRLLEVNASSHSDLFWLARGGLVTYFPGIITSATMALANSKLPEGAHWCLFKMNVPLRRALDVMDWWQQWSPKHRDTRLGCQLFLWARIGDPVPGGLYLTGTFLGRREELQAIFMDEVWPFTGTHGVRITRHTQLEAYMLYSGVARVEELIAGDVGWNVHEQGPDLNRWKGRSLVISEDEKLGLEFFQAVVQGMMDPLVPGHRIMQFKPLGGAIIGAGDADTPIAHRGARYIIMMNHFLASNYTAEQVAATMAHSRALYFKLAGLVRNVSAWAGYLDYDLPPGVDLHKAYLGANAERVQSVIKARDPDGVFSHPP